MPRPCPGHRPIQFLAVTDSTREMTIGDVLPARHAYLEVADFGTELVIYDPETHMAHLLRGLQALLFDACDGSTATESLVAEFVDAGLGDREQVLDGVRLAFIDLVDLALIADHEPPGGPPCIGCFGAELSPQRPHRERRRRGRAE